MFDFASITFSKVACLVLLILVIRRFFANMLDMSSITSSNIVLSNGPDFTLKFPSASCESKRLTCDHTLHSSKSVHHLHGLDSQHLRNHQTMMMSLQMKVVSHKNNSSCQQTRSSTHTYLWQSTAKATESHPSGTPNLFQTILCHCTTGPCTTLTPGPAVPECAAIFLPTGSSGNAEASYSVSAE